MFIYMIIFNIWIIFYLFGLFSSVGEPRVFAQNERLALLLST